METYTRLKTSFCPKVAIPDATMGRKSLRTSVLALVVASPCGYAFYGEKIAFKFGDLSDLNDTAFVNKTIATIPIVLDWMIAENITCAQASQDSKSYACRYNNSQCIDIKPGRIFGGYRCSCKQGYQGNPYLSPGCKDVDECADPNKNDCEKNCINIPGNYSCSCPHGYIGDVVEITQIRNTKQRFEYKMDI
ncbi:EGF-like domain-containing protein [Heracleum sosnowskyi]|uniref:EGF-like domain-containing protein n=1 Tax=Heracleum sosnowskyi TaxID=360622 RepID=A0AAD8J8Q5_9APIA|nr:EGF-like domain-containing protein [Heracleum sosnowskyi]